jgi:hypothetical protein
MAVDVSALEETLREHQAGNFIKAVSGAADAAADYLTLTVRAFYREPELLYVALSYASARGVAVLMAPEHDEADHTFEL